MTSSSFTSSRIPLFFTSWLMYCVLSNEKYSKTPQLRILRDLLDWYCIFYMQVRYSDVSLKKLPTSCQFFYNSYLPVASTKKPPMHIITMIDFNIFSSGFWYNCCKYSVPNQILLEQGWRVLKFLDATKRIYKRSVLFSNDGKRSHFSLIFVVVVTVELTTKLSHLWTPAVLDVLLFIFLVYLLTRLNGVNTEKLKHLTGTQRT